VTRGFRESDRAGPVVALAAGRRREWLARAVTAADAAGDAKTLRYVREVRAQLERTPPRP
jgi:hypothetical protein